MIGFGYHWLQVGTDEREVRGERRRVWTEVDQGELEGHHNLNNISVAMDL